MISVNPASLEVIAKYQPLKKSEILNKINSTHDEFLSWKDISIDKRKDILIKYSDPTEKEQLKIRCQETFGVDL